MSTPDNTRPRETTDIGALNGYVVRKPDDNDPVLELYGEDGGVAFVIDATRHATALEDIAHEIAAELGTTTSDEDWSTAPTSTGRWPPGFEQWPLGQQIAEAKAQMKRAGQIRQLLTMCGLAVDEEIATDRKLTKEELAAIYLNLEGIANVQN